MVEVIIPVRIEYHLDQVPQKPVSKVEAQMSEPMQHRYHVLFWYFEGKNRIVRQWVNEL